MKKLLSLLLALVMLFSLAACSDSGGDSNGEEETEETEYPIVVEFNPDGTDYTLEIQNKKEAELTFLYFAEYAADLEDRGVYVDDVELEYDFHAVGTYEENKGEYALTLDEVTLVLEISGKNKEEAKEGLLTYWENSDERYAQTMIDLLNGEAVPATTMVAIILINLDVEIEDGKVTGVTFYESNSDVIKVAYTLHSNGQVETETHYKDGEPTVKYTYDKNGNLTDTWHPDSNATLGTQPPATNTNPGYEENYPTEPPPTQPEELNGWYQQYYSDSTYHTYDGYMVFIRWDAPPEYYPEGSHCENTWSIWG